jgi:hypothetical protein
MCSRDDFSTAIIDAREEIKIGIHKSFLTTTRSCPEHCSAIFPMLLKSEIVSVARVFEVKTPITTLAIAKISSTMLSGDFGSTVVCASEHHFFLDITF